MNVRPQQLLELMTAQEKRLLLLLLVVSFAAAILESVGLGIIFVFLKVITDTGNLGGVGILQDLRAGMSGISDRAFLLLCLGAMLVFFFFRHAAIFANVWLNAALRQKMQFRLSRDLFSGYLSEPYASFVKFPSSTVVTTVTSNVAGTVAHGIVGLIELASAALMLLGIMVLILGIKPLESLFGLLVTAFFAGVYWFVSYEDAGTTMLVLASCLALFCGAWLYVQDRARPVATGGESAHGDAAHPYLPDASVWPFVIGIGAALTLNGLILGWPYAVPGVVLLGLAVVGFVGQSRRRD